MLSIKTIVSRCTLKISQKKTANGGFFVCGLPCDVWHQPHEPRPFDRARKITLMLRANARTLSGQYAGMRIRELL